MVNNLPTNARDARYAGLIPGSGRSPGVGNGNQLQYSCPENSMDRGTWRATVMGSQNIRHNWETKHMHTYLQEKKKQNTTFEELVPQLWTNAHSHTTNTMLNFLPLHEAFGKHWSLFSVPIILHFPEYHWNRIVCSFLCLVFFFTYNSLAGLTI